MIAVIGTDYFKMPQVTLGNNENPGLRAGECRIGRATSVPHCGKDEK